VLLEQPPAGKVQIVETPVTRLLFDDALLSVPRRVPKSWRSASELTRA